MKYYQQVLLWGVFIFFAYHLVRDVLQIMGVETWLTQVGHRPHIWCASYCKEVTLLPEILTVLVTSWLLYRKKFGPLGWVVIGSLPFWVILWLLP